MHRIDTDGHVSNLFDPGDPLEPRLPTQIDHHWLNAIQEEIAAVIEAGYDPTLVKGTNTQLRDSLSLKAHGRVKLNATPGGALTIEAGAKNLDSASLVSGVPNRIRVQFTDALPHTSYTVTVIESNLGGFVMPFLPAAHSQAAGSFDFVLYDTQAGAIVDPATLSSREFAVTVHAF